MADSQTTVIQKRRSLHEIEGWTQYISTHGLQCIDLADLRTAEHSLRQTRVGVPGEAELIEGEDPLWLAFKEGWAKSNFALHAHPLGVHDWAEIKEVYQQYRRTLEE